MIPRSRIVAKQEAFEESIRLKNQFRSLDDDEVEFLDSVLESTRAQEAAVKKETAEQLAEFHRQREEAERSLLDDPSSEKAGPDPGEEEQWARSGKKRKRSKKDLLFPAKPRKLSAGDDAAAAKAGPKTTSESVKKGNDPPASVSTESDVSKSRPVEGSPSRETNSKKEAKTEEEKTASNHEEPQQKPQAAPSLGLVAYGSDDDSD